jgi:DNA invertase Pin-like site-specific DNA recombinase
MPDMTASPGRYVAYLRVSTTRQGERGLGMDAQRAAVEAFARQKSRPILDTFVEVESGKRSDRPELAKALDAAKKSKATLVIAKLDRLARNVAFIANLMDAKVDFVAVDQPHASRFTIHIMSAVAEDETRRISERTKAALAAAKARGIKLGSPIARETAVLARAARSTYAKRANANTKSLIRDLQSSGVDTLTGLARALQARGIKTPGGRTTWQPVQVKRLLAA